MDHATPGRLAKEFGLSPLEMYKILVDLRVPVKAMGGRLSASQEATLRRHLRNVQKARPDQSRKPRAAFVQQIVQANRPLTMHEFPKTCGCCDRRWIFRSETDEGKPLCPDCVDHVLIVNEPPERRLARSESHAGLYLKEAERARELVKKYNNEKEAAYNSRLKWMRAVVEVVLDHEEGPSGACWCGDSFPCRTWQKLERANPGIHRQVEKWASYKEEQLDEVLYGDKHRDREYMAEEWLRSREGKKAETG